MASSGLEQRDRFHAPLRQPVRRAEARQAAAGYDVERLRGRGLRAARVGPQRRDLRRRVDADEGARWHLRDRYLSAARTALKRMHALDNSWSIWRQGCGLWPACVFIFSG